MKFYLAKKLNNFIFYFIKIKVKPIEPETDETGIIKSNQ
jgi:hypothetical protein